MLGIEVDGYSHQIDEVQQRDEIKALKMKEMGITILRFRDDEIFKDLDQVILNIDGWTENWQNQSTETTHP